MDVHRIPSPKGLYASVVHPKIQIKTSDARNILSETITLKQHVLQSGNLGGLIIGLYNSDFDLIGRSLQDLIIEPQRSKLIPGFKEIQDTAMNQGALGCSISGAGPSIVALSANSMTAENVGNAMQKVFTDMKITSQLFISTVNQEGAYKF